MQMFEPKVKVINKQTGLYAVQMSKEDGWGLAIGKELVCGNGFETLLEARIYAWKNRRKLQEVRMAIIMKKIAEDVMKDSTKNRKKAN